MNKIALGTAQFGLPYGINNKKGQLTLEESIEILDYAGEAGIDTLDTAMHYGNALEVIGHYHQYGKHRFKIISKFQEKDNFVLATHVARTLKALQISFLEGLLCHSFDFFIKDKALRTQLYGLKKEGIVKKIGISIYSKIQLEYLLDNDFHFDIVQLPYNLLDNYTIKGNLIKKAAEKGIEVHARSTFLQGLFFKTITNFPSKIQALRPYVQELKKIAKEWKIPMHEMALNYTLVNEHIHKVIIGIDSLQQLKHNLDSVYTEQLSNKLLSNIHRITVKKPALLQPINW